MTLTPITCPTAAVLFFQTVKASGLLSSHESQEIKPRMTSTVHHFSAFATCYQTGVYSDISWQVPHHTIPGRQQP